LLCHPTKFGGSDLLTSASSLSIASEGSIRLPAEWEPQSAIQLTWPAADSPWGVHLPAVEASLGAIAAAVSGLGQTVVIACHDVAHTVAALHQAAANMAYVRVYEAPSNDSWTRDHGGITVFQGDQPVILDFAFTGWGGKYAAELDNTLTQRLGALGIFGSTPIKKIDFILEGGAIDSDGAGTLLTTKSCLHNPNRYKQITHSEMEKALREHLGVERILWLEQGAIAGDDTDGHVDTLARFCSPDTIAHAICENANESHYTSLLALEKELGKLRTADGQPYNLVPLPLPAPVLDEDGNPLPATYANFLLVNDAVLVPTYLDPYDEIAMGRLQDCFPTRAVIGVNCCDVIRQFGSLHCLTMQFPAGVVVE